MTQSKMHLSIETFDRTIDLDLVESLKVGTVAQAPGGVNLEYKGTETHKSFEAIPDILQFIVTAARDVDMSLFAAWLYAQSTKKPVVKITLNKRVLTTITPESIQQLLVEEIQFEK